MLASMSPFTASLTIVCAFNKQILHLLVELNYDGSKQSTHGRLSCTQWLKK
jgi:hypothetical protein